MVAGMGLQRADEVASTSPRIGDDKMKIGRAKRLGEMEEGTKST